MNKYITQVKSGLLTALIVVMLMQMVTAIIAPFTGIIFGALVVVTVGALIYYRVKKL